MAPPDPHVHAEREDHGWAVEIPDHPGRVESPEFRRAKAVAHKILAAVRAQPGSAMLAFLADSPQPPQAHHAGSLWVHDGDGWLLLLNVCGVEWSAQFSADPARVDALRAVAQRLYARFPETLDEMDRLGYREARTILGEPVTDAASVARWTDSLFNACVMLTPALHSGVVSGGAQTGGWHHYPKSVWDQQVTKADDFRLWVTGGDGLEAAVAPVAPRGSGDGRVQVLFARPGSELHRQQQEAHAAGEPHILDADHPLAVQAFAGQVPK